MAVTIHQAGRVADANPVPSGPCRPAASTEPVTATPSEEPICRLVEAIPAAVPARARGIPATALLVIGALTQPMPQPSTRQPSSTYQADDAAGEEGEQHSARRDPGAGDQQRHPVPLRAITRPHSGAEPAITTAIGSRNSPAVSAL